MFISTTARLTASYLGIIMLLSIGFSVVFYHTSFKEIMRQAPPAGLVREYNNSAGHQVMGEEEFRKFYAEQIAEGRQSLLTRLVIINCLNLIAGLLFSYYLARLSLRPLEESVAAQVQFVGDASHELRTPLTALQTMNEVALRKSTLTVDEAKEVLRQNVDEVVGLRMLTDGLLRLARHNTQPLELREVALQEVVTDAINQVLPSAQAKGIAIDEQTEDIVIKANKESLTIAVTAVLDNAVKYSDAGGNVRIKATQKGKEARLTIGDSGPGIAEEDIDRVFERFYRSDQSRCKEKVAGHGIGLSIAKKIVERHHGSITVRNAKNRGAIFTFRL